MAKAWIPPIEDVWQVPTTAEGAVECRPTLLAGLKDQIAVWAGPPLPPMSVWPTRFVIQWWEGIALERFWDLDDPAVRQEILARFDEATFPDWGLEDNWSLPEKFGRFIAETKFPVILQWKSRNGVLDAVQAVSEGGGAYRVRQTGSAITVDLNYCHAGVVALAAKAWLMNMAHFRRNHPQIVGFGLDSERPIAPMPGQVTEAVSPPGPLWPDEASASPYTLVVPPADPQRAKFRWRLANSNRNRVYRSVREASPLGGVLLAGDDQLNFGEPDTCDRMQQWAECYPAPYTDLWPYYWVTLWQAKCRLLQVRRPILCGPQVGHAYRYVNGQPDPAAIRPAPVDLYSTACWVSLMAGAQGLTGWGHGCMKIDAKTMRPGGQELWDRMLRIEETFVRDLGALAVNWTPAPRKTAVLWSLTNEAYESGRAGQPYRGVTGSKNRSWAEVYALPNALFALLLEGEPADIIFDDELLMGNARREYERIVVPCLYVADQVVIDVLADMAAAGCDVVAHAGGAIEGGRGIRIVDQPLHDEADPLSWAPEFDLWGRMDVLGYRCFLRRLAGWLLCTPPQAKFAWCEGSVVCNELVDPEGKPYIVMVNDVLGPGPEEAWYRAWAPTVWPKIPTQYKLADKSAPVMIENHSGRVLTDTITREQFALEQDIPIEAGWGRVLE